jgi:hypothetical protein
MYKENSWINIKTQVITGVNKAPGSPRMWLNRALDTASADVFTNSIIKPKQLSVAAIWLRPCVTLPLPYNALVRYFDFDPNKRYTVPRNRAPLQKAIGITWAVPYEDILPVLRLLKMSGAEMVWWCTPEEEKDKPNKLDEIGIGGKLNHAMLYELFEKGMSSIEVAHKFGALPATIRYVYKKWKSGKPSCHMHFGRKPLDHEAVVDDLRTEGLSMQDIADKHGCTRFTVHKLAKAHGIVRA